MFYDHKSLGGRTRIEGTTPYSFCFIHFTETEAVDIDCSIRIGPLWNEIPVVFGECSAVVSCQSLGEKYRYRLALSDPTVFREHPDSLITDR